MGIGISSGGEASQILAGNLIGVGTFNSSLAIVYRKLL